MRAMDDCIVGPGAVGTPYGTVLSDLLATKNLKEAVIASAFLSRKGAERLLDALLRTPKGARVTVLIGSMNGFTRKAALVYLQSFVTGKKRKIIPAKLELVHPFETNPRRPQFHVKAAYALVGKTKHIAIVGSHNLTKEGLDSDGELGVRVEGAAARAVRDALVHWSAKGQEWAKHINRYTEATTFPGAGQERAGRAPAEKSEPVSGDSIKTELIGKAEQEISDKLEAQHEAIHGADENAKIMFFPRERSTDGYPAGSIFDMDDVDSSSEPREWELGARRGIAKVVRIFPSSQAPTKNLYYRWLRRYRVTPDAIRLAKDCGIYRNEKPTGVQLLRFEKKLRAAKVKSWKSES